MFSPISRAFAEAFRNLRNNFFQTFLSVLGVIIGVGALVAMLAMIDGLEAYAQERIADRSSLENLIVVPNTSTKVDGIRTSRDTIAELTPAVMAELIDSLPYPATGELSHQGTVVGYTADSSKLGLRIFANTLPALDPPADSLFIAGSPYSWQASAAGERVALVNENLARRLLPAGDTLAANALGKRVYLFGDSLSVTGIYKEAGSENLSLNFPLATMPLFADAPEVFPSMNLALAEVNSVLPAQEYVDGWMERHFSEIKDPTETFTQTGYLEQLAEGILVFRLVMGLIIGIAVVVGGVGVMNVLLMSISERTPEIGVRKAVGANRRNIVVQFLSESIAISTIGSVFGIILGMGVALLAAPVLNMVVEDMEFRAVFSGNTLLVVAVVAIVIGVIFGTYPARKAAGLDPVEAIRR